MDLIFYFVIFLLSFVIMFIAAISGGTGLILRPALLFLGIPASIVIATLRVTIVGEIPRLFILHKHKKIDWRLAMLLTIPYAIGSVIAGFFIIEMPFDIVEFYLGVLLFIVAGFYLVKGNAGLVETKSRFSSGVRHTLGWLGTIIISFFGTFTGGMGPMYTSLYIWVYGKSYIKAASVSHIASFFGGLVGALIFIGSGLVDWQIFIAVTLGLMGGSHFGTIYGLKKGENYVRFVIIAVAIIGGIKLIWF
jgi:hypothetical protein